MLGAALVLTGHQIPATLETAVLHSASYLAVLTRQAQSRVLAQHVLLLPC